MVFGVINRFRYDSDRSWSRKVAAVWLSVIHHAAAAGGLFMDESQLHKFEIQYPGHWIVSPDRNWAAETADILSLAEDQFLRAVVTYAMFKPVTRETFSHPSKYVRCLNSVYAMAFVYSIDSISKLLDVLHKELKPPDAVQLLISQYSLRFGDLKHIRDSIAHIEDRGRALDKNHKPIPTSIIVLGCFNDRRFEFTASNGKCYAVEISDSTLLSVHGILQEIINSYNWE